MNAAVLCCACGTGLAANSRFCNECGVPVAAAKPAEFKQVTVLFADVVGSMVIAAAVGAERLHEIMSDVFACAATVTRRYGGTVDKFTGDGIMALFGAPVALEDHAVRACLAALDIQRDIQCGGWTPDEDAEAPDVHYQPGLRRLCLAVSVDNRPGYGPRPDD